MPKRAKSSTRASAKKAKAKKASRKKASASRARKAARAASSAEAASPRARKAAVSRKKTKTPAKKAAPEKAAPAPPQPAPRPSGPRAHPDAGLTKSQVKQLHERLLKEREAVLGEMRRSVQDAVDEVSPFAESIDQAQHETEQNFRLRLADKQRKLLNEIDTALRKLEIGEYGICEGTEDPIGYRRLEIRPWARYSVEYKELKDRRDR